ncbi:ATP-binding protein [Cellvibrio sp.]|uniref:ATP-binding protein n=1 Tax=Cellvibrio sp. TaxID=1965322 RepID=UPI0039647CE8
MTDELELYKRRYEREKRAREQAEELLETKSAELYRLNEALTNLTAELEQKVLDRTLELQKARDLAIANNEAKSLFLANMSHEIRTPMNGILGVIYLLESSELTEHQRHLLGTAKESGELLLSIINDILDVSKIEAGELTLEHINFSITDIIKNVTENFLVAAQQKGLTLHCDIDAQIPTEMEGDPTRVRQVLYNLISNAIKFTPQGSVKVSAKLCTDQTIEISVSDTGIGIAEDKIAHIFSPFTQADDSITRKFGGTGLGLAICSHLTKAMGKEIRALSIPGKGSTFRFWLDIKSANEAHPKSIEGLGKATPHFSGALIMLVDDNAVNREIGSEILRAQGLIVDCFEDGSMALQAISKKPYQAVLMDVQMPVMDGLRATREIRALGGNFSQIPIIAMTAHARKEDIEKSLNAGMNAHLTKPIEPQKIFALLEQWISKKQTPTSSNTPEETEACKQDKPAPTIECATQTNTRTQPLQANDFIYIDILDALARTNQNHELLTKVLLMFLKTHSDDGEKLITCLNNNHYEQIKAIAHKLKGSSASIGAKKVSLAASELEQACKTSDYAQCKRLIDKTNDALSEAFTELQRISIPAHHTTHKQLSYGELTAKVDEFIATSQTDFIAAEKVLNEILATIPDQQFRNQISLHFDNFEIEAIYPLLEKFLSGVDSELVRNKQLIIGNSQ